MLEDEMRRERKTEGERMKYHPISSISCHLISRVHILSCTHALRVHCVLHGTLYLVKEK